MIHKDSFVVADGDVQHMGVLSFCLVSTFIVTACGRFFKRGGKSDFLENV